VELSNDAARACYNAFCEYGEYNVEWEGLTDEQREVWGVIAKRLLDAISAEDVGDVAEGTADSEIEPVADGEIVLFTGTGDFVAKVRPLIPVEPTNLVIWGARTFIRPGGGWVYHEVAATVCE
jgi:hypothetical protein